MHRLALVLLMVTLICGCDSRRPDASKPTPIDPELAALIESLRSGNERERSQALAKIHGMGLAGEPALPALIEVFSDPSPVIWSYAGLTVGTMANGGSEKALHALRENLGDADRRSAVICALHRAGPVARDVVPRLTAYLEPEVDEHVRRLTVGALAAIGGADAARALAGHLGEEDPEFRSEVAWALAQQDRLPDDIAGQLESLTGDSRPDVVAAATFARWKRSGEAEPAVTALRTALSGGFRVVEILRALAEMGPSAGGAVDEVMACLYYTNSAARVYAATALGAMQVVRKDVIDALAVMAGDQDTDVQPRISAVMALGEFGPAAAPAARAVAVHLGTYPGMTIFAEETLRRMGPACIPVLQAMLGDDQITDNCKKHIRGVIDEIQAD